MIRWYLTKNTKHKEEKNKRRKSNYYKINDFDILEQKERRLYTVCRARYVILSIESYLAQYTPSRS